MTEELDRDWSGPEALGELLEAWREGLQDELHTSTFGTVESYDASTQRADVRPAVRRTLYREDGTPVAEDLPVLRAVPIVQLAVNGFVVHLPVRVGDEVLVIVPDRDPSRWIQTGRVSDAPDGRLHHLAHSVAIPWRFTRAAVLSPAPPTDALVVGTEDDTARITLASDGSATVEAGTIKLGGAATEGVARLGDTVDVTVPTGAFTDSNGDTSPTAPVTLSGTITSASSKVSSE